MATTTTIPTTTERRADGVYIRIDFPGYGGWHGPFPTAYDAVRAIAGAFDVNR